MGSSALSKFSLTLPRNTVARGRPKTGCLGKLLPEVKGGAPHGPAGVGWGRRQVGSGVSDFVPPETSNDGGIAASTSYLLFLNTLFVSFNLQANERETLGGAAPCPGKQDTVRTHKQGLPLHPKWVAVTLPALGSRCGHFKMPSSNPG